jgi:hypothetical protein
MARKRRSKPGRAERLAAQRQSRGGRKLALPPDAARAPEALSEFQTKEGLRRNLARLLVLLQRDATLQRLRFGSRDMATVLGRISDRDEARAETMDDAEGARYVLAKLLPRLLTKRFLREAEETLTSAMEAMEDRQDARACLCGLFLIRLHHTGVPPQDNPLWDTVFRLSFTEAAKAEQSMVELLAEVGSAEEAEAKLRDPAFRRRVEAAVRESPALRMEGERVVEVVHLPLEAITALAEAGGVGDGPAASEDANRAVGQALQKAAKRDITAAVARRVVAWLNDGERAALRAGKQQEALRLARWRIPIEGEDFATNPVLLALYWQSLVRATREAKGAPDSPLGRLLNRPHESLSYTLYGNELMAEGETERAERVFRAQTDFFDDDYEAYCNLAQALSALGRFGPAADALQRALSCAKRQQRRTPELVTPDVVQRIEDDLQRAREEARRGRCEGGA